MAGLQRDEVVATLEQELAAARAREATLRAAIEEALRHLSSVRLSMRGEVMAPYRLREELAVRALENALVAAPPGSVGDPTAHVSDREAEHAPMMDAPPGAREEGTTPANTDRKE